MCWDLALGPDRLTSRVEVGAAEMRVLIADDHDLLRDTLVMWGGEFGRSVYSQGKLNAGRDHHGRCFSMWMAGGGVKGGVMHGETDDYCYNIVKDPVHIHDLQATVLHCLGIDHTRLTFRFQGRDYRLTDVAGRKLSGVLSESNQG